MRGPSVQDHSPLQVPRRSSPHDDSAHAANWHARIERLQQAIVDAKRAETDFHRAREVRLQSFAREVGGEIRDAGSPPSLPRNMRLDYEAFLYCFIALGGLRRNHAVLDVGCGRGWQRRCWSAT